MEEVRTNLRLPAPLYEQIKRIADKELRSINAQMVVLLSEAVALHPSANEKMGTSEGA